MEMENKLVIVELRVGQVKGMCMATVLYYDGNYMNLHM